MRHPVLIAAALLGLGALPALAQDARQASTVPALPAPPVLAQSATSADLLRAARAAVVAGRSGEAQESLEMAETRALDRSVPQGETFAPNDSKLVSLIRDALRALGGRDKALTIAAIDRALAT
jgi:hypothetical protein